MKKTSVFLALIIVYGLTGCNQQQEGLSAPAQTEIASTTVKIEHNYSLKDGFEYGYEPAISSDQQDAGQQVSPLMMFKFAGEKEGLYQAYTKTSGALSVMQCGNPCEFIKIMVFVGNQHITTERIKATEGTIAWLVMADSINGELEPYILEKNNKRFSIWFDEKKGLQKTQIVEQ